MPTNPAAPESEGSPDADDSSEETQLAIRGARELYRDVASYARERRARAVAAALAAHCGEHLALFDQVLAAATVLLPQPAQWRRNTFTARPLVRALFALYSRALETAEDVRALAHAGSADGVRSSWRTLHELSVVGVVLAKHGDGLAERYLQHQVTHTERLLKARRALGIGSRVPDVWDRLVPWITSLVERHTGGDESVPFRADYGWAHGIVPLKGQKRAKPGQRAPRFDELERHAELSACRSAYVRASGIVHASLLLATVDLAQPDADAPERALAARARDVAEPVVLAAQSLLLLAGAFVDALDSHDLEIAFGALAIICEELAVARVPATVAGYTDVV